MQATDALRYGLQFIFEDYGSVFVRLNQLPVITLTDIMLF